ncbi:MAG: hypothetical protein ACFBWO_04590 [Paracoccaceae bacterium]
MHPLLWSLDPRVSLKAKLIALKLVRARVRLAWMAIDPRFLLTALATIVALRVGYRLAGVEVTVANLLAGTAVAILALAVLLGGLDKRSDARERRVAERALRRRGYRLTGGRLSRCR